MLYAVIIFEIHKTVSTYAVCSSTIELLESITAYLLNGPKAIGAVLFCTFAIIVHIIKTADSNTNVV